MPRVTEPKDARITVRIPQGLRAAIEREATKERRSVADMTVMLLTDALAKRTRKGR